MAGLDDEPLTHGPGRHDGMAACRLCSSTDASADHGWCAASGGLVCDSCCRRVLLGDVSGLRLPAPETDLADDAETIISACLGCERGQRWYANLMLERVTRGVGNC